MKKQLILLMAAFSLTANSQKVKVSTQTIDTYFVKYPEEILSYKFLEYKTLIDVTNTKIVINSGIEKITETSINENIFTKIRNDGKQNFLPIGNLKKTGSSGSGILDAIVEIGTMNLTSKADRSGVAWENKFRIFMTLEVPLKITFKDSFNGEVVREDMVTIKYENQKFADMIFNKDQLQTLLKTDFTTINAAKEASSVFLKANADNIPMSVFDLLVGSNQIAGYWTSYNKKYKLFLEKTGTLFLGTFKDDKNEKYAEYNKNINRLKELSKEIGNSAFKDNYISKDKLNEIQKISQYLESETKINTNEEVTTTLETALLTAYFITDDFEKASQIVEKLKSKGKINMRLNHYLSLMKQLSDDKARFEENKTHSSATYTDTLFNSLK
ncbi:hypothetical protein [Chryseobacterium sp. FH1]|uniref:hypothetical protein n=1 Tax=Chryseobacterium sp. FH1 TaxID=1233951 RepID=UPI0004E3B6D3|nr:hypothetical protein [Chryseobacterium sp. FH1]KFC24379.1 hypothetical protein IO90_03520 [Chryseobacterium sp. FH1]